MDSTDLAVGVGLVCLCQWYRYKANNRQGKVNTHTISKNKDVTKISKAKGAPTYKAMLVYGCGNCISTIHAPAISSNNRQAMLTHSKYTQYSPCRTCVSAGK